MQQEKEKPVRNRYKFFRPIVPDDYIERGEFERNLVDDDVGPILVVVAPAGYGKSSLVSHWIDQVELPHAWISLDPQDNDLRVFLGNLAAALRDHCPAGAEHLTKFCDAQELPPPEYVADILSADIEDLANPFAIVLDDYYTVEGEQMHQFVDALLPRRPQNLRMALISRRTPPLALGRPRSQGLVMDVRLRDLQLDKSAERLLVATSSDTTLSDNELDRLHSITEGWPVGLRLFLLARPDDIDMAQYLETFDGSLWQIQEYLTEEVLNALPKKISEIVLRSSILRRFSSELIDALEDEADGASPSGQEVVDTITRNNLFCIPLSAGGQWFRYHHQFQDLLIESLNKRGTGQEIQDLHYKAANWYAANNYPEDAIYHFLQGDDESSAIELVERFGAELKVSQQWARLDQILSMLSQESIETSAELLMLLACVSDKAGRISQMIDLVQRAEEVHRHQTTRGAECETTLAHICATRSSIELHLGKTECALESAKFALDVLPDEHTYDRGVALYVYAYAKQTQGHSAEGYQQLRRALESSRNDVEKARILFGRCFLDWASGDLEALSRDAGHLRALGEDGALQETFLWGSWYGGGVLYLQNDLNAAEDIIEQACNDPWPVHIASYAFCIHIQALIHAARDDLEAGRELLSALAEKMTSTRSASYLPDMQAIQAELALRANDYAAALKWALSAPFDSPVLGWGFVSPGLKAARIFTVAGSAAELRKADNLLKSHEEFYTHTHNVRHLIDTLALRSLHCSRVGEGGAALPYMKRAIELAQPSRMSRAFIDLGPEIIPLLNRLDASEESLPFIGEILSGFDRDQVADLPESLSKREQEVLALLSSRISNKEIGEQLFISPATVKRHTHSIYQKLNVGDRHEAVAKAVGLGLLSE